MEMERMCKNCEFYYHGVCHRYPPFGDKDVNVIETTWCGEFRRAIRYVKIKGG